MPWAESAGGHVYEKVWNYNIYVRITKMIIGNIVSEEENSHSTKGRCKVNDGLSSEFSLKRIHSSRFFFFLWCFFVSSASLLGRRHVCFTVVRITWNDGVYGFINAYAWPLTASMQQLSCQLPLNSSNWGFFCFQFPHWKNTVAVLERFLSEFCWIIHPKMGLEYIEGSK